MNIKEIATRLEPQYWHRDRGIGEFFDTCGFAEALVAEIQRRGEPVAFIQADPDGHLMLTEITKTAEAQQLDQWDKQMGWTVVPLFTFPPSIEALEDKVAEAIAAYLDSVAKITDMSSRAFVKHIYCAAAATIRSGEYRKFMKGD